jgi:hypothetical protein
MGPGCGWRMGGTGCGGCWASGLAAKATCVMTTRAETTDIRTSFFMCSPPRDWTHLQVYNIGRIRSVANTSFVVFLRRRNCSRQHSTPDSPLTRNGFSRDETDLVAVLSLGWNQLMSHRLHSVHGPPQGWVGRCNPEPPQAPRHDCCFADSRKRNAASLIMSTSTACVLIRQSLEFMTRQRAGAQSWMLQR